MRTLPHWYRCSLDLDQAGNVVGSSYEVRTEERIVAIHTMPLNGPFDSPAEVLETLLADTVERYGVQLTFF